MTEEIGILELREHASEVIRRVREERPTYDVTHRGKVVARLVPALVTWDEAQLERSSAPVSVRRPSGLLAGSQA